MNHLCLRLGFLFALFMSSKSNAAHLQPESITITLLGSSSAGKTSLVERYRQISAQTPLAKTPSPTHGLDIAIVNAKIGQHSVRTKFLHPSGREQFKFLAEGCLHDSQAVIIAYDVSEDQSFAEAKEWLENLKKISKADFARLKILLLANKSDLLEQQNCQHQDGLDLAGENQITFAQISVHNDSDKIIQNVLERFISKTLDLASDQPPLERESSVIRLCESYSCLPFSSQCFF